MTFEKYTISDNQLIEVAIEMIEMNNSRCVIVTNTNGKVLGVLSEGDILRSILKGVSIKSPVKNIMMINFKYLLAKDDEKIMAWFKEGITLIPILSEGAYLKDIIVLTQYFEGK